MTGTLSSTTSAGPGPVAENTPPYTASDAFLDGLEQMGVTHLFANFGSDHPEIIEALARRRLEGRLAFRVILCPHENVALTAAHGFTLMHREPAAVLVHVDAGTQTMGGAVHNAFRGRTPVLIFAGETPYTIDGELFGSRNRPAQVLQDVPDQHGIVRSYMKWAMSVRTGKNMRQLVYRGLQIAQSEPAGPVYLTGAREVMSEVLEGPVPADESAKWPVQASSALPDALAREIVETLVTAEKAVIITAYSGRNHESVAALQRFAETVGAGVIEASPTHLNFPRTHPLHAGFEAGPVVRDADAIFILDCDVPWVNALVETREDARVYQVDLDPLKVTIPLWHMPVRAACMADSALALPQLNAIAASMEIDARAKEARIGRITGSADRGTASAAGDGDTLTAARVTATLARLIDEETVLVDETVTSSAAVLNGLPRDLPGTYYNSGGSALGFAGGASIGVKLSAPERTVVCLTGDGSYLFGVPSAVYMVSARYAAPFLTVIFNNGGWNATKQNVLRLRPDGIAEQTDQFWVSLGQDANLAEIAAASGGCLARTVSEVGELEPALTEALAAVRAGRSAVVDVRLKKISEQED